MAPVDHSKWDNIGTDSEPEVSPREARPGPCPTPQPPAPTSTTTYGAAEPIQAVIVWGDVEKRGRSPWSVTRIAADHPAFSTTVPPIPSLIEVPLVLHRDGFSIDGPLNSDGEIVIWHRDTLAPGREVGMIRMIGEWSGLLMKYETSVRLDQLPR
ncbi:hypothetical protein HRG_004117 [Hirsutella rhossiliensis]|uniref:Uncharacterized protein n=1 Tax=Hirsutella rhossiliensis TaxID=111463 RepID=A0A9P8N543_9HYPO|nr:uncharacterized protein HRG_04117 [Hirsutella rhossiliensis]KAH0966101.1 hypothetical protein HRG_04117 [Hirsutella rhossiliensis]